MTEEQTPLETLLERFMNGFADKTDAGSWQFVLGCEPDIEREIEENGVTATIEAWVQAYENHKESWEPGDNWPYSD